MPEGISAITPIDSVDEAAFIQSSDVQGIDYLVDTHCRGVTSRFRGSGWLIPKTVNGLNLWLIDLTQ